MTHPSKRVFFSLAILIIIIALLAGGAFYYLRNKELQTKVYRTLYPSFCDQPISFQIDKVDSKFGISKEEFEAFTLSGANIWNKAYGEEIFTNNPEGKLKVNLVFDERQQLTNQIGQLSEKITQSEGQLKPSIESHKQKTVTFNKKMADFNDKVKYWNDRGGAPEEDYNKLLSEQKSLESEAAALNAEADKLNTSAGEFNDEVKNYNSTVSEFNTTLKLRPEEGLFDGPNNTISIYFYIDKPEIIHTLAHEFGHSLGINHVKDENSVMFSKTNKSTELSASDINELKRVCQREAIWEILRDRYF